METARPNGTELVKLWCSCFTVFAPSRSPAPQKDGFPRFTKRRCAALRSIGSGWLLPASLDRIVGAVPFHHQSVSKEFTMKQIIQSFEQGVLQVVGRPAQLLLPGVHKIPRKNASVTVVDVRPSTSHISGQEVLTLDGITVKCGATVVYRIVDALIWNSAAEFGMTGQRVHLEVQMALRDLVGTREVEDLLATRSEWSANFTPISPERAASFGIEVLESHLRDISFPGELKSKFAQVAVARQETQAALERARGEQATLRSLANSAKMLENNPELKALRTLMAVENSGGQVILRND